MKDQSLKKPSTAQLFWERESKIWKRRFYITAAILGLLSCIGLYVFGMYFVWHEYGWAPISEWFLEQ